MIKIDSQNKFSGFANGRTMPISIHPKHPPIVRHLLKKNLKSAPVILKAKANIKKLISSGVSTLDAIEHELVPMSHEIAGKIGKRTFYNTAFQYAKRNHCCPRFLEEKKIENFNDVRSAMTNPRNDKLKWATRNEADEPELILCDEQVDELFVILQTPSQRKIMANSTVLNVDQNDQVTPVGGCRTLTVSSCYKGNVIY